MVTALKVSLAGLNIYRDAILWIIQKQLDKIDNRQYYNIIFSINIKYVEPIMKLYLNISLM